MSELFDSPKHIGRAAGGVTGFVSGVHAGTIALPIPGVGSFVGGVVGALVGVGLGGPIAEGLAFGGRAIVRGATHRAPGPTAVPAAATGTTRSTI
jgi:hypothetical protein